MPLEAVRTVSADDAGVRIVDIKHCVRAVKVFGGESNVSRGLSGVVLNKDTAHPQTHRRVLKLRMVLLDCSLEYKNGESRRRSRYRKKRIVHGPNKSGRNRSM